MVLGHLGEGWARIISVLNNYQQVQAADVTLLSSLHLQIILKCLNTSLEPVYSLSDFLLSCKSHYINSA
jgi:hypothetical protein